MRRVFVGAEPEATHEVPPPAPNPLTATAPITLDRSSEARRAYRVLRHDAAATALVCRLSANAALVRPLVAGLTPLIAAALNSSRPYTRAALRTWKLRPAYCRAVLDHPVRFDLDGDRTDLPAVSDLFLALISPPTCRYPARAAAMSSGSTVPCVG